MGLVHFTPAETYRIPSDLRPLMQTYPQCFDNLLEVLGQPPFRGEIESMDIYFDDEVLPALSFYNGSVSANSAAEEPQVLTVFVNDECGYLQIHDRVLLNRVGKEFLNVFEGV
ncbi:MAG: hypothetical protein WCD18_26335 [Thermosynechococcaceae cyanobacterium]